MDFTREEVVSTHSNTSNHLYPVELRPWHTICFLNDRKGEISERPYLLVWFSRFMPIITGTWVSGSELHLNLQRSFPIG